MYVLILVYWQEDERSPDPLVLGLVHVSVYKREYKCVCRAGRLRGGFVYSGCCLEGIQYRADEAVAVKIEDDVDSATTTDVIYVNIEEYDDPGQMSQHRKRWRTEHEKMGAAEDQLDGGR